MIYVSCSMHWPSLCHTGCSAAVPGQAGVVLWLWFQILAMPFLQVLRIVKRQVPSTAQPKNLIKTEYNDKNIFENCYSSICIWTCMLIFSTAPYLLTWDISIYFMCQNLLPLPLIGPRRLQPATSPPLVACSNRNPPDTHEFPQRAEKFTTQENKMELYGTGRWKA